MTAGAGGIAGAAGTPAAAGSGTNGGSDGEAGEAGESTGGSTPGTAGASPIAGTNSGGTGGYGPIPPDEGNQQVTGKVDLLIAVDNSISMAEKQQLFAKTMPELVKRLISPRCVNGGGAVTSEPSSPDVACAAGSKREFEPVRDLHVGVISSSLGSHGASGAKDVCVGAGDDDKAHLLGTIRPGVTSYDDQGYLKWDPDSTATPPGENDAQAFADSVGLMIQSAGEQGCGFEAQLESVYRFLIDPEPPASVVVPAGSSSAVRMGIDNELLEQRANFLRPDSSVAVVVLTDENDCSVVDEGYGWLISRQATMYRSTSQCLTNPNDACCQSCAEVAANPGCPAIPNDVECQKGQTLSGPGEDDMNLRCWDQKRRFGFSLLYPIERYVSGFAGGDVPKTSTGELVPNPLFHRDGVDRHSSLFTFTVLGGVPWQDISTTASLTGENLVYLDHSQLAAQNRWDMLLGDANASPPVLPTDPHMIETPEDRTTLDLPQKNPITKQALVASSSTDPEANAINGHEQKNLRSSDLQYACTFPLPEPIVCDKARFDNAQGCDCYDEDLGFNRPQCQPQGGGEGTITQNYGKAYPTLRELEVASQLGRRAVVGSVCARNTSDDTRSDFGYRPLFDALGRRIASTLVKP